MAYPSCIAGLAATDANANGSSPLVRNFGVDVATV